MKVRTRVAPFLAVMGLLVASAPGLEAAEPMVSNVGFALRTDGSALVDIWYDVADADGDILTVGVSVSDDGGATWQVPVTELVGDVGPNVSPGPGKSIVWDVGTELGDLVIANCSVRVGASDAGIPPTTHSPGNYWIMDWLGVDWSDDAVVERTAKADVAVISMYELWDNPVNEGLDVIGRLKAENPDLVVLGYFLSKTNKLFWANSEPGTFTRTLYERTLPFWTTTTVGDTLMNWAESGGPGRPLACVSGYDRSDPGGVPVGDE